MPTKALITHAQQSSDIVERSQVPHTHGFVEHAPPAHAEPLTSSVYVWHLAM